MIKIFLNLLAFSGTIWSILSVYIVDKLLPQGMHILCGASKIGKSWMMLRLCLQVANGEPLWGLDTHKCDVLYLCLEDTYKRVHERLYDLTDNAPANLRFTVMCDQIGGGLCEQITDFLVDYPDTKLVVIDTLQKVRDPRGGNGKNGMYGTDYEEITSLKAIADKYDIAVVALHHPRKQQDADDPFNQVSGTTGLVGADDSTYVLKKDNRSSNTAVLLAPDATSSTNSLLCDLKALSGGLSNTKTMRSFGKMRFPLFFFDCWIS